MCIIDALWTLFLSMLALALYVQIPTKDAKADMVPPGQLSVEISWPENACLDIDLWTQAPGGRPVGYSNHNAAYVDLLRDDLGLVCGPTVHHYENVYSRGLPPGPFTVNLHWYATHKPWTGSVPVDVLIQVHHDGKGAAETILHKTVPLSAVGQETTVARFRLDAEGRLEIGSLNDLPKPLRSAP
jgi:hypothetical protein